LPHVLAFALVAELASRRDGAELFARAGTGFRDFTRIAASSPEMWRDVALANREALLDELARFRAALDNATQMLAQRNGAEFAALAEGTTTLRNLLDADDTDRMVDALTALGVRIERDRAAMRCVVHGAGGHLPQHRAKLFLGNAGTAFRPLTAALAILGGDYELSGVPRMHERPIGDLVDAIIALGCDVRYLKREGFPPLAIG